MGIQSDKICDQVSDAVLDAHVRQDPYAKVAVETVTKNGMVMLVGELSSKAEIDYQKVVRDTIKQIGYDDSSKGLNYKTCNVILSILPQTHICKFDDREDEYTGARDQGLMFGYATDETEECMPFTCVLAHGLNRKLSELRRNGELPWAGPDSKTQVTVEYKDEQGVLTPLSVHTVVISVQHDEFVTKEQMKKDLNEKVIDVVIPPQYLDDRIIVHLNPCGKFIIGGPQGDAGLTGRKIIVDTYGGWGAHGGGCFSGKDCSKVDRSASYAARWIAKSLVKAGLCKRVLIQVSYSIGIAEPLSISVFTYGTGRKSDEELLKIIDKNFDLRPGAIIRDLNLRKPIYQETACYGHFGRPQFSWEQSKTLSY